MTVSTCGQFERFSFASWVTAHGPHSSTTPGATGVLPRVSAIFREPEDSLDRMFLNVPRLTAWSVRKRELRTRSWHFYFWMAVFDRRSCSTSRRMVFDSDHMISFQFYSILVRRSTGAEGVAK